MISATSSSHRLMKRFEHITMYGVRRHACWWFLDTYDVMFDGDTLIRGLYDKGMADRLAEALNKAYNMGRAMEHSVGLLIKERFK